MVYICQYFGLTVLKTKESENRDVDCRWMEGL